MDFDPLALVEIDMFEALKKLLTPMPILALPRQGLSYKVDSNASDKMLGAVLMQTQTDGNLTPIGYFSRRLSPVDKNYDTSHREYLAVVWAKSLQRPYHDCTTFPGRTRRQSLWWTISMNELDEKLTR